MTGKELRLRWLELTSKPGRERLIVQIFRPWQRSRSRVRWRWSQLWGSGTHCWDQEGSGYVPESIPRTNRCQQGQPRRLWRLANWGKQGSHVREHSLKIMTNAFIMVRLGLARLCARGDLRRLCYQFPQLQNSKLRRKRSEAVAQSHQAASKQQIWNSNLRGLVLGYQCLTSLLSCLLPHLLDVVYRTPFLKTFMYLCIYVCIYLNF